MIPFTKILIANRGEIVTRIARTARRWEIATSRSTPTPTGAVHVAACDDAVPLGGRAAADSYLRIDKLLAAARSSGADAIHPGYGFLSENAAFAAACTAPVACSSGRPPPPSLRWATRRAPRMAAAGMPVVPGYDGDAQSTHPVAEAQRIGFPVMVKAAAGGGGRGMRLVRTAEDLAACAPLAASEAARRSATGG